MVSRRNFTIAFFYLVSRDLVNSFNAAYKESEFSISQRTGVIALVPKEDSGLIGSLKLATNHSFKLRLRDRIKSDSKENRKDFSRINSS